MARGRSRGQRTPPGTGLGTLSAGRPSRSIVLVLLVAMLMSGSLASFTAKATRPAASSRPGTPKAKASRQTVTAGHPTSGAPRAATGQRGTYVALGDSYSSGEGLGDWLSGTDTKTGSKRNQCHRSPHAYPDLSPSVVLPNPQSTDRVSWLVCEALKRSVWVGYGRVGVGRASGQRGWHAWGQRFRGSSWCSAGDLEGDGRRVVPAGSGQRRQRPYLL